LEDASKLPNLTKELVARGYSEQEISKILGGNFLRIFGRIWK
jgi:membrane dipeptidase